jgi:O-antigen ligase
VSEFLADYGQSRWEYVEASIQMIKARPALGFGLGTWPEIYPAYGSFDAPDTHVNHAHNDLVEWLSEGGVLFLIPIAILIVACVRIGFEQPWALGPAAVMIHSLVDFPLQKMAIFSTLLLILAGGCDRSRRRDP